MGLQTKTSEGPPGVRPWGLLSSLAAAGFLIASGAPALSHTLYVEDPLCQSSSDTKDVSAPIRRYCLLTKYRHSLHHVRAQLSEDTYELWTQGVRRVCTAGYPPYWAATPLLEEVLSCENELTQTLLPHLRDQRRP